MSKVEEPAQRNTASLILRSIAGESRSHPTKGGLHLGNRQKIRRDLDNHGLPADCQTLVRRQKKTDGTGEIRG